MVVPSNFISSFLVFLVLIAGSSGGRCVFVSALNGRLCLLEDGMNYPPPVTEMRYSSSNTQIHAYIRIIGSTMTAVKAESVIVSVMNLVNQTEGTWPMVINRTEARTAHAWTSLASPFSHYFIQILLLLSLIVVFSEVLLFGIIFM